MKIGLEEMKNDTCEFCSAKKKLLNNTGEMVLYKWCECDMSKAIISSHDKSIKDKRTKSLYYDVLGKVKEVQRIYKDKPVQTDVWTDNVEQRLLEFLEWDKDLLNDMKMLYNEKYNDNPDGLSCEKYYNRYTQLYFETFM